MMRHMRTSALVAGTVVAALYVPGAVGDAGLRDQPIEVSGTRTYLDGAWTAHGQGTVTPHPTSSLAGSWKAPAAAGVPVNITVTGSVPGDLLTDLHKGGVIPDPYLDTTWIVNASLWNDIPWVYSTQFTALSSDATADGGAGASTTLLVFDGVKMGATVRVNGHVVGVVSDQFLRYIFPLDATILKSGPNANTLQVSFGVGDVAEQGRFMACTGGWDWAPYSYTITNSSGNSSGAANTFSKGIWKSVYLVEVPTGTVAITHVTPHTHYNGSYPVTPLEDGAHGGFTVNVTTHVWAPPGGAKGSLSVSGGWASTSTSPSSLQNAGTEASTGPISIPAGDSMLSLELSATAEQIKLWWPNGLGAQPLYNVTTTWTPLTGAPISALRRVGFRVFALVTVNDTDAAYVAANASAQGTGTHGMFFRVNGAAVYSRGANMVPMEELEGRMDGEAHRILVRSSADAGMNTLRVWGGGIFYPTEFYDACDEYGVMVYHDMQYAGTGGASHGPIATSTQAAELRHQIRRLSHHPAIVLWDGANEVVVNPNSSSYIFATFVMTVVAQEDQSRVVWPSSPAKGWITGVNRLYQTPVPSLEGLTAPGGGHIWNQGIESHAPYQLGSGWPTVNGGVRDGCFDNAGTGNGVMVPNTYKPGGVGGVAYKNIYASEFGTGGSSSFESMSATLSPQHWGLHGGMAADTCAGPDQCLGEHQCNGSNPMTQRNYGCDGQIREYWGNTTLVDLTATGEAAFKGQLYQCQMVQAFVLKQVYESRRAQNQFGHLVWMLNEIWPTVGWGSLEYGPPPGFTSGQVRGGRWKPLHYFYKQALMTDVMATCGANNQCYLSNHRASRPFSGTVTLTAYDHFGNGTGRVVYHEAMSLPEGPGAVGWFNTSLPAGNTTALISTVKGEDGSVISEHMVQLVRPMALLVPNATVSFNVSEARNPDGTIDVAVTSDKVALWVTLTTLAQGRFSDNAFFLPATTKTVQFIPFSASTSGSDLDVLKSSLRVEDYSMYKSLPPAPPPPPPPAPPAPPGAVCDPALFLNNTDYHDGQGLGHDTTASPLACCQLCASPSWAAKGCNHFTYAENTCWLMANNDGKRASPGSTSGAVKGPGM
eukprot:m.134586 g.134586  ORF g.134586 m.134586 type:complete len:1103 (-) comp11390_c0_seq3:144-3452(-)